MKNDWPTATVDEITEKVAMGPFGSSIKVDTFVPEGIPIISGQHLHGFRIDDGPGFNFITREHAERLSNANVVRGDIVLTHRGTIGQVAYVPENSEYDRYVVSQSQFYIRCDRKKVIPEFLMSYLRSREGQHQLLANTSQVGVPSIAQPVTYLRTLNVPLPPLPEQRRIAHILGTLDDKIELNRRMNETLEEMARAIFKDWFVDFGPVRAKMEGRDAYLPEEIWRLFPDRLVESELEEAPEGWGVNGLGEIARVVYGAAFASNRFNDDRQGVPLIRIRDLRTNDPSVFTDEVHPKAHLIEPGDIVVGMDGEFKSYYWLGERAWLNQRVCHFEPLEGVSAVFLRESIAVPLATLERSKVGTTVIHLSKRDIDSFKILAPSENIHKVFANVTDPLIKRIQLNAADSRSMTSERDAMLPKLISGEINVVSTEGYR